MKQLLVVGGLTIEAHDALSAISSKSVVPNGILIRKPIKQYGYNQLYADNLLQQAFEFVFQQREKEEISILLVYVDYNNESTKHFVDRFFPFSLAASLPPIESLDDMSKGKRRSIINNYVKQIQTTVLRLRSASNVVKASLSGNNLSPLLLPPKNFGTRHLDRALSSIFFGLVASDDPKRHIERAVAAVVDRHPWQHVNGRRCLSNGQLYFKSPGSDRHGYFQHSGALLHPPECLLGARSRLGGSYSHTFHYDCSPVTPGEWPSLKNCHLQQGRRKEKHANIAPNDFTI